MLCAAILNINHYVLEQDRKGLIDNETWYPDNEGDPEPCNAKATSYCSNMSGSFIVNAIRKYVTKQPYDREICFNFPAMMLGKKR